MQSFSSVARDVSIKLQTKTAAVDRDVEWQRVNSLIADVLKDAHVLYAKLARLQGDFAGKELDELEKVSEGVLAIGGKLSSFSKMFYEGGATMTADDLYGAEDKPLFGGSEGSAEPMTMDSEPVAPAPAPTMESSPSTEPVTEDLDIEFDYSTSEQGSEGSESAGSESSE